MKTDYYDYIDQFLHGDMDDKEKIIFEDAMSEDSELAEAVKYFPLIREALLSTVQQEARLALQNVQEKYDVGGRPDPKIVEMKYSRKRIIQYAVASLSVIALIFFGIHTALDKDSPEIIYANYYQSFPNLESGQRSAGSSDEISKARNIAYMAYDLGDFEKAIRLFEALPEQYEVKMNDRFYLGITYLEVENWQEAIVVLQRVAASESNYNQVARWYLALGYLKTGDCNQAKSIFESLRSTGLERAGESSEILRKMKC